MSLFRRERKIPSDQEAEAQLAQANRQLRNAEERGSKVDEVARKLRRHYEDNQFAARVFQHLAEDR